MKRTALGLFAVLLLGGCGDSVEQTEMVDGKLPTAKATTATEGPMAQNAASDSALDTAEAASPLDAERLLASTLECAKADSKRVMVHLGAPW